MERLLIATRNRHKVQEIRAVLGDAFACLSLADVPEAPTVSEDAPTFEGNARKKAEGLADWLRATRSADCAVRHHASGPEAVEGSRWREIGLVLADDSGLEVDALGGAPGVHSARFAALDAGLTGNASDADNNAKLLRLLQDVPMEKRTARFHCVIALVSVMPHASLRSTQCFDGVCEGRIGLAPRGQHGFGYDPLFFPEGFDQSFAELGEDSKNRISHRARALTKLKSRLAP